MQKLFDGTIIDMDSLDQFEERVLAETQQEAEVASR